MTHEKLIGDLESPDPSVRLNATQRIAEVQSFREPYPVVAALVRAVEDTSPEVRRGAVRALRRFGEDATPAAEALARAVLADESLLDDVVETLKVAGERCRQLAYVELVEVFREPRDAARLWLASTVLLGMAEAGVVGKDDLEGVGSLLATSLDEIPSHLRTTAVDASLRLGLGYDALLALLGTCDMPEAERQEVHRQVYARKQAAEAGSGKKVEGSGIGLTLLRVAMVLLIGGPLVAVLVVLFPAYPLAASILLVVALLVVAGIAWFWWRCPRCRKPFAGQLVNVERYEGTGTATVRDTHGVTHTVQTRKITTVRTYRCRHCGEVFKR